jgi:hypothetical protein
MTYVSSPNSGQTLGQTRDQIRTNSDLLKAAIEVNHVALGLADVGKHKFVVMPVQGAAPTTAAGEAATYSKNVGGASQLFFIRDNTAGTEFQFTAGDTSLATFSTNTAYAANHSGGWTFLPGGMIIQYGVRSTPGNSGAITFPLVFPSGVYSIQVSLYRASADHNVIINSGTPPTTAGFNYLCDTSGSVAINWVAIGK